MLIAQNSYSLTTHASIDNMQMQHTDQFKKYLRRQRKNLRRQIRKKKKKRFQAQLQISSLRSLSSLQTGHGAA